MVRCWCSGRVLRTQIAEELLRAGKRVCLSVGAHVDPPRSYRGCDFVWRLGVLGKRDGTALEPGLKHVTIAVSGACGGHTVELRRLAAPATTLVARTSSFNDGVMSFAPDLADNFAGRDANYLSVLHQADACVSRNCCDLPKENEAREIGPEPPCVTDPVPELNVSRFILGFQSKRCARNRP